MKFSLMKGLNTSLKNKFFMLILGLFAISVLLAWWFKGFGLAIGIIFEMYLIILIIYKPEIAIFLIIIFIFLLKGPFEDVLNLMPREVVWGVDINIVFLFLRSLLSRPLNTIYIRVLIPLSIFIFWSIISSIVNNINFLTVVLSFKDHLRYVFLSFAIANVVYTEFTLKKLVQLFILIGFFQIPVTIYQFSIFGQCDYVSGTLGRHGTGELLIVIDSLVLILFSFSIYFKKTKYVLLIPFFIIPLILGSARASLILMPVTLLFLLFIIPRFRVRAWKSFTLLIFNVGAILFLTFLLFSPVKMASKEFLIDFNKGIKQQVISPVVDNKKPGRLISPIIALKWLKEKPGGFLVGYGFGITKESYFEEYTGKFYSEFSPKANQLSTVILEGGIPSLLFYLFIIILAFKINIEFFKKVEPLYWKSISFAYFGIIIIYLLGITYMNIWRLYYATFPFWFFLGIISGAEKILLVKNGGKSY